MQDNTVAYNTDNYTQKISVIRINPKTFKEDFRLVLNNSSVLEIEISNSIEHAVPTCTLILRDSYYAVVPFILYDGFTIIEAFIEYDRSDTKISHKFTLINKNILDQEPDAGTFKLYGISVEQIKLLRNIRYSAESKQPLTIFKEITNQSNIELQKCINPSGGNNIDFYTHGNMTVKNSIDYILDIINVSNGLNLFFYSLNTSKFVLDNLNFKFSTPEDIKNNLKDYNNIEIWSGAQTSSRFNMAVELSQVGYLTLNDVVNQCRTKRYRKFDKLNRRWIFTQKNILNDFPVPSDNNIISLLSDFERLYQNSLNSTSSTKNQINKLDYNNTLVRNYDHSFKTYEIIKNIFLNLNVVEFETYGNTARDVGDLINLYASSDDHKYDIYEINGVWYIQKVRHTFSKGIYKCKYYCCRMFKPKTDGVLNLYVKEQKNVKW